MKQEIVRVEFFVTPEQRNMLFRFVEGTHFSSPGSFIRARLLFFQKLFEKSAYTENAIFTIVERPTVGKPKRMTFTGKEWYNRGFSLQGEKAIDVAFEKAFFETLQTWSDIFGYQSKEDCVGALVRFLLVIEPSLREAESVFITIGTFTQRLVYGEDF